MWRIIVRIGYFNDTGSALRNRIAPLLEQLGLHNTDTGTGETDAIAPQGAAASLGVVLNELAMAAAGAGGTLEHLWVYIDRQPPA